MANDDRHGGRRDRDWGPPTEWSGDEQAFGGGWGNQTPHPERLGDRHQRGLSDDPEAGLPRYGSGAMAGYGADAFASDPGAFYGAPGYDPGFAGRRFDRADVGSTGTHGAHPIASPFGGGGFGPGGPGLSSTARRHAMVRPEQREAGHDPHYSEWRSRQIAQLDSDYENYCRERQSRFEQEFGAWRERRGRQRELIGQAREHMEVIGSDGGHVGSVDAVRGDHIVLTRSDSSAGGVHHSIPCSWVESVDDKVRLNIGADEAMSRWREEERSRALFERRGQGQPGPHMLNRSFSGTYSDRDR